MEVVEGGELVRTEASSQTLRWFTQEEFADLLHDAGFSQVAALKAYSWEPAEDDSVSFLFAAS